jgi:hypothetical protein
MSDPVTVTVLPDATVNLGVVHGDAPAELVRRATEAADVLAKVIEDKKLYSSIQGKRYVRVEGWTSLAVLLGCLPREVSITRREDGTYEAVVELARMSDGAVLTRASAECGMDETKWAKGPDYARRSMAATRATSKACRLAFSWVMVLAGFAATPLEEMIGVVEDKKETAPAQPLSEMPAALAEDVDKGELLEGQALSDLLTLVAQSGVTKKAFPEWYFTVVGRAYDGFCYIGDALALKAEATKRLAQKGRTK